MSRALGNRNRIGVLEGPDRPVYTSRVLDDVNLGYSDVSSELKVIDVDAINNMIENIIRTTPGERPFEPTFGSRFMDMIFEPCDDMTAYKMETAIFDALKQWMPYIRVVMGDTSVQARRDEGIFDVRIGYMLTISGVKGQFRMKFGLGRS